MLESGFGVGVVSKLAHLLIEKYAYDNAGVHEWYEVITEATNNELAGQFFMDYFTQPGFPLVRVAHTPNGVILKQETMIAAKKANTSALVVPLELSTDGSNARQRILLNESEQTFPLKHHGIVVVDPDRKAYAVIVYEPEIYIRLLQCAQTDSCTHVNATNMRHIAEDFCWAFLNDHLAARDSRRESIRVWAEFTRLLSALNYVRGSCACCMDKNLSKTFNVPCKWHWKDRCEQIQLVKQIHSTSK
ncbi:unnamed protein product [Toxocara canis]|nr:unnamed protein product [Toxocara canis]